MTPDRLLQHFDRISEAPDAIPRMRRFILDLAVRGKLVPQNSDDEPAAKLLNRIEADFSTAQGATSFHEASDRPFDIPDLWIWTRIGSIVHLEMGQSPPSEHYNRTGDGIPFYQGKADFGKRNPMPRYWCSKPTKIAKKNDILISVRAPVGPTNVASAECCIGRGLAAIRPHKDVNMQLFLYWLNCFEQQIAELGFGTTFTAINKKQLVTFPLPLPPLAEQHRIVAKVDELMTLCDELEAAQARREKRRDRLVAATLHGLNNGDTAAESVSRMSFTESAHFYFNHLSRLTTCPEHIKQLRQTILNLAVRGKLVSQDPNDEPAAVLLKKIASQRKKLLESGLPNESEAKTQLRKQELQEIPHNIDVLPNGWHWATLMQCAYLVIDCHNKTALYAKSGVPLLRTTNIRNGKLLLDELCFVSESTFARWSVRCEPAPGDILITREAPMGEVAQIPEGLRICMGQRMMLIRLIPDTINPNYLLYSLRDPFLMDRIQDKPVGATVKHLRVGGVETLLVPLPPIEEQHRIVAKVDELMALCDELEANLATNAATQHQFLEATLHDTLPALNHSILLNSHE